MYKQPFLPGFPDGAVKVGAMLSIQELDYPIINLVGGDNYFSHNRG